MKTMKYQFMAIMLALGAFGSAFGRTKIPTFLDSSMVMQLGTGFNSRSQKFFDVCVDNSNDAGQLGPIAIINPAGDFKLKLESNQSKASDKLGLNIGGRYRSGATTTSAAVQFMNESTSNEFSISAIFMSDLTFKSEFKEERAFP